MYVKGNYSAKNLSRQWKYVSFKIPVFAKKKQKKQQNSRLVSHDVLMLNNLLSFYYSHYEFNKQTVIASGSVTS